MSDLQANLDRIQASIDSHHEKGQTGQHVDALEVLYDAASRVVAGQPIRWCEFHEASAWCDSPSCYSSWYEVAPEAPEDGEVDCVIVDLLLVEP